MRRAEYWPRPTWLVIGVLSFSGIVTSLQQTLIIPLLSVFPTLLGSSVADTSWLVTVTLLVGAVATPILSKLADMHGKRRMMLVCLASIGTGAVVGGLGSTLLQLVIGRGLIGVGLAIIPIGISIMRDELPPERVGLGIAMMSASFGIGSAVGFPLAGVLFANGTWQLVFWISAVLATLLFVLIVVVVRPSPITSGGSFDYVGAILLTVALVALLVAITNGAQWGWLSPPTITAVATAVIVFPVWAIWELRARFPIVDIRVSTTRPILFTNIASTILGFSVFCNMVVSTQQVQVPIESGWGLGLDTMGAGFTMLPGSLAFLVMAPISAWAINRRGGRKVLVLGAAIMAVAYLFRVFYDTQLWELVLASTVVAIGTALVVAAAPWIIMRYAPIEDTAAATGLNALVRSVGTSVSSAAAAAVLGLTTIHLLDTAVPSQFGFRLMFALACAAAVIGGMLALVIPRGGRPLLAGSQISGRSS